MKRILCIILISLCFVIAFVLMKYALFERALQHSNRGMRSISKAEEVSDLFIGSSMFRQGIDASALDDGAYLLAYNGNQPFYEAMEARRMLDEGAKIRRIIVDMYPYSVTNKLGVSDVRLVMDGDIPFTFSVFSALHDQGLSVSLLFEMLFQNNNEIFLTFPISYPLIDRRYLRGSATSMIHGKSSEELDKLKVQPFSKLAFDPVQEEGLAQLISLCHDNDIDIVFLETPKYCKVNDDKNYRLMIRKYAEFLSEKGVEMILFQKSFDTLTVEMDRSKIISYGFDDTDPIYYTDLYHMSYEGRRKLTEVLSMIL